MKRKTIKCFNVPTKDIIALVLIVALAAGCVFRYKSVDATPCMTDQQIADYLAAHDNDYEAGGGK